MNEELETAGYRQQHSFLYRELEGSFADVRRISFVQDQGPTDDQIDWLADCGDKL